jgi:hypothetical protein
MTQGLCSIAVDQSITLLVGLDRYLPFAEVNKTFNMRALPPDRREVCSTVCFTSLCTEKISVGVHTRYLATAF